MRDKREENVIPDSLHDDYLFSLGAQCVCLVSHSVRIAEHHLPLNYAVQHEMRSRKSGTRLDPDPSHSFLSNVTFIVFTMSNRCPCLGYSLAKAFTLLSLSHSNRKQHDSCEQGFKDYVRLFQSYHLDTYYLITVATNKFDPIFDEKRMPLHLDYRTFISLVWHSIVRCIVVFVLYFSRLIQLER